MRSSSYSVMPARALRAVAVLALAAGVATAVPAVPAARAEATEPPAAPAPAVAAKPYMGWTSWTMQSSKYPGLNPKGDYSYLSEANVIKQTDAMAAKLKKYGYEYVNIDAGWWMDWSWKPRYDEYGRQKADPVRFPSGMKAVADRIHAKGLKAGIYLPVGLEKGAYGDGKTPIRNAEGCTTGDIVYDDLRTTNGWDSAYKIDFSDPCAQKYIDSQAQLFADWGYDFLKLDGVGPGSFKTGDNYNNVADVAAWQKAIATAGRPIHLELSWSLDYGHVEDWKKYSNGWRIDTDVECYCNTLVSWENSVEDDLTKLDSYGLSLLTNREVIAINQSSAPPAEPVTASDPQQVWAAKNPDGTYTVALFNLSDAPASVTANWSTLGFKGKASVRDVWNEQSLGSYTDKITQALPAHGSRLFTVTPRGNDLAWTAYEAESGTLSGNASVADCSACSDGRKVGNLYTGGRLTLDDVVVAKAGTYQIKVSYISGDARSALVSANGGGATSHKFAATGDWGTVNTAYVPVKLKAGANTITFDSGTGYAPDIDRIDVPNSL